MNQENYVRGAGKPLQTLLLEIGSRGFKAEPLPVGYVIRISIEEKPDAIYDWYFTKSCALVKVLDERRAPRMGWFYTADSVCDFILENEGMRPIRCANCGRDLTKPLCECGHDNKRDHVHVYEETDKCVKCGESCV